MKKNKNTLSDIQKDFISLFSSNATDVSKTCKACNISRNTYYVWLKENETFKKAIEEVSEAEKDWVESQMKLMMKGIPKIEVTIDKDGNERNNLVGWHYPPNTALLIFFAKTKMKDRGYDENSDNSNTDNTLKITHNIIMNTKQDNAELDFDIDVATA